MPTECEVDAVNKARHILKNVVPTDRAQAEAALKDFIRVLDSEASLSHRILWARSPEQFKVLVAENGGSSSLQLATSKLRKRLERVLSRIQFLSSHRIEWDAVTEFHIQSQLAPLESLAEEYYRLWAPALPTWRFQGSFDSRLSISLFSPPYTVVDSIKRELSLIGSDSITSNSMEILKKSIDLARDASPLGVSAVRGAWVLHERPLLFETETQPVPSNTTSRVQCLVHSLRGPAVRWSDGTEEFYYHGIRVAPNAILNPESITLDQIHNETNVEVRRALVELLTPARYLAMAKSKLIDGDFNDQDGMRALICTTFRKRHTFLVVCCPTTGRVYHMAVPYNTKTCVDAARYLSSGITGRRGIQIGAS